MAAIRPNLARRPFVDSRPANVAAVLLLFVVLVLTLVSVRTVHSYLEGSRQSRAEIASLRTETARFEAAARTAEGKLTRFDLAGMSAGAEEANALVRLRAFSWSRFLTRLEKTLPNDVRVVSVTLSKETEKKKGSGEPRVEDSFQVSLSLVSRDPDGLPKLIRAFYASPWFDAPTPLSETGGEQGSAEGRGFVLDVLYRDREAKP